MGESGKVILQFSIAVFRALSKNFLGKDVSAPLEKIGLYAYASVLSPSSSRLVALCVVNTMDCKTLTCVLFRSEYGRGSQGKVGQYIRSC